mgnify:CR=1 FL=1
MVKLKLLVKALDIVGKVISNVLLHISQLLHRNVDDENKHIQNHIKKNG